MKRGMASEREREREREIVLSSKKTKRVLKMPFRTRFVLREVELVTIYTDGRFVGVGTIIFSLGVSMQTTPLTQSFEVSKPETIKTHFNWGDINLNRVTNVKKIDVIGQVLTLKG